MRGSICEGPNSGAHTTLTALWPGGYCTDDCILAWNSTCEDGDADAEGTGCEWGTDCTDCGPRYEGKICYPHGLSCDFVTDGKCDDGGPGALTSLCEYGTDCYDCGPRVILEDTLPAGSGGSRE